MKKYFFSLMILILAGMVYFYLHGMKKTNQPEQKPNEWFFMQRAYPFGQINQQAYIAALKQASVTRQALRAKDEVPVWKFEGPLNIGGRLSDVEMPPDNMQTMYVGAASGGVFKSVDAGLHWTAVFDEALSLSVGDIALAPSNPSVIYVGTGEANCGGGSLTYDGVGIYKSTDEGATWTHMGLEESRNIGRMAVHPTNPDIVYVAAMGNLFADNPDRGVFKTTDGGQSWQKILYISDSTGAIDVVLNPAHPDTVYAAMWERVRRPDRRSYGGSTCGIYRTYDGGENWTELTAGLPSSSPNIGRIGIDLCDASPQVLYAIYADNIGYYEGLYKSVNGGNTWTQTNDGSLSGCYSSYGWWFGRVEVNPLNPDVAFVIAFDLYATYNGGNSYTDLSGWDVHVDQHAVYFHPLNDDYVILGNDGGLYSSQNQGSSWYFFQNLPITQFYTCEVDNTVPQRLYGGTQDNGTNRTLTGNTDDWENILGGDGFYVLVDPANNQYVYAEYQYGSFSRSTNGGNSFQSAMSGISGSDRMNWNTPVVFDPQNPSILYYGSNKLYRSTNKAVSWSVISPDLTNGPGNSNIVYATLTTIAVSPVNPDIIYAGTDDANVWVTADGGGTWTKISATLPDRWVTRVAADPVEESTAYVCFSGYRYNEYLPHIFRTTNLGAGWEDISGNMPEIPVNDIIVDPDTNSTIYIATDAGVFVTRNLGNVWEVLGDSLPNVPVCDLVLHQGTRTLIAATFGRSMYSYDLYQDTLHTGTSISMALPDQIRLSVFPNPFSTHTEINFHSSVKSPVRVTVLNASAIPVKTVYSGFAEPGSNRYTWDGSNDAGMDTPAGVYYCLVSLGGKRFVEKICRIP